ncbi:exportin-5 isoform X2 [Protopterus annectens]|uniref:exportin-5 isoform X2 n=1 Tax=Protopterus annectens TaxID=7888 RepID=UPI001CFB6E0E|nr:exportin-5 isoform X2 [Protopterus annectens]
MAEQVNTLCDQLIKAVNVMMDMNSSQRYRLEALKFCEEFKEKCAICIPCGLKLTDQSQPPIVRHFGLQVLEHCVKFRWNTMQQRDKVYLKNNIMGFVSKGTKNILEEESHIKDVVARIMVEMIKREWPQHWPEMLRELETLSLQGETQSEIVLLILLRLAEDVVTFQTLPTQRRRDIQQSLTYNMEKIFAFLQNTLQQSVNKYRRLKGDATQEAKAKGHCRVGIVALNTLAGYMDWVAMSHITADNCKLLEMLCLLLNEPELQLEAAECLLIAVSRKGKVDDRKPLTVLFGDVAMHYILTAAQSADEGGLIERNYVFLKRLCQLLCALGTQLCSLLGADSDIETPSNFGKYLEAFLVLTTHSSQVGFPSKSDSPCCEYSRMDFDSDEDFNAFFNAFRAQQGEVIRMACKLLPMTAFEMAAELLRSQLRLSIEVGSTNSKAGEGLCSIFSPSFVQWDAMTFFAESVISQMFRTMDKDKIPVNAGIELLKSVLEYDTRDPLILSCLLTNVSALFPFVSYEPDYLPRVLSKLFSAVTFEIVDESKAPRTRAVKNVRRHACSSLIKLCRDYSHLVLPCFDMMYSHVKEMLSNELLLTQMEKCALMEALVLVSNQFKNYEQQQSFLKELMIPVSSLWLSDEMESALWDPVQFLSFIGADKAPADPTLEDGYGLNRSRISFCVYTILGVMKRARWPNDLEEAKAGGFVVGYTPNGSPIYRNPCTEQVLKLLDNLLALIRTHNNLFLPEMMAKLDGAYAKSLEMLEVEKNSILGLPQPLLELYDAPVYKTVLERMQGFFCTLYDNCFHILGNAGHSLQRDFYATDGLSEKLINSAFVNLENIPDYRLRPILRVFVKPLVLSCPPEYYEEVLCPILGPLFSFLKERQIQKWQVINQRSQLCVEEEGPEENPESQEMLEEQLIRLLTREIMDLISVCCIPKKGIEHHKAHTDVDDEEMMATDSAHTPASNAAHSGGPSHPDELSELGKCLMKNEEICTTLLVICYSALSWRDTLTCQRTTSVLCWPLIKQVVNSNLTSDAVTWFYTSVLQGLQMHGQHEGCMAALVQLAFHVYEAFRPRYPELKTVMEQVPEIHKDSLEQFDSKLATPSHQKMADKRKKDHFKRLITGCIGQKLSVRDEKSTGASKLIMRGLDTVC